jgi:hypothetical protein
MLINRIVESRETFTTTVMENQLVAKEIQIDPADIFATEGAT